MQVGVMPAPKEGPVGLGGAGDKVTPPEPCRGVVPVPSSLKASCGGLGPSGHGNNPSPIDPIHPQSYWRRDPRETPSLPIMPFMVPTLMTLVTTTVVYTYGSLTSPPQDVIQGGYVAEYRPLCRASPKACPCLLPSEAHWHLHKGDPIALTLGLVPYSSRE